MQLNRIPRNTLYYTGHELKYISEAMHAMHLSGDGSFTKRCSGWLKRTLRCKEALLTHSCTAALEMAALLLDLRPGDEIIMPSFTFSSTATAFALHGGIPVFVDIDPETLCLSPDAVAVALSDRTRAVIPVHYAGLPCDMDAVMNISRENGLVVIEDAAQALGSRYKGEPVGNMGHLVCLSFHESKNVQCGEGGALLINDERYIERAMIVREKGTNRSAFLQGQVDKYTWVDVGSSFLPGELNAAFLLAQLEEAEKITKSRLHTCELYDRLLRPLHEAGKITLCDRKAYPGGNGHIFWILAKNFEERLALASFLKDRGILSFFHYVPLHSSPAGKRFGKTVGSMIYTNSVYERLLRLPIHVNMPDDDIIYVSNAIMKFYNY